MAEFKIDGRMKVKSLKEKFFNEYGGVLRVYAGRSKAQDDASLASIRANDAAKGGELVCQGNRTVGKFEKEMWDIFGIKVQVAIKDDSILALDGITLAKLKDIPERATKEIMEQFIAYKRKGKDEVKKNADIASVSESKQEENGEYSLIEFLRDYIIIETEDQVYYDSDGADDYLKDMFIDNIVAQCWKKDVFKNLKFKNADSFIKYLEEDPDELSLANTIVVAAYCTFLEIEIEEDTRVVRDFELYYFNCNGYPGDFGDFHYEYETDIDLG